MVNCSSGTTTKTSHAFWGAATAAFHLVLAFSGKSTASVLGKKDLVVNKHIHTYAVSNGQ